MLRNDSQHRRTENTLRLENASFQNFDQLETSRPNGFNIGAIPHLHIGLVHEHEEKKYPKDM